MLKTVMKIEIPALDITLGGKQFHDYNWGPGHKYWCGHTVPVPEPYQAGAESYDHHREELGRIPYHIPNLWRGLRPSNPQYIPL